MHKIKEHDGRRYQAITKPDLPPPPPPQKRVKCQLCPNAFFSFKNDLAKHMKNHHTGGNGEYQCPECSKIFYTLEMFNEHRQLHDQSVPKHSCKECGKEFITQRKLKEHSIVHKERIMYKCNVCAKVFLRSQTLQYHRTICKAAFPCEQCVDSFMTNESLEKHKLFHEVEQQYTCQKCNKVFPNHKQFLIHNKRHSLRMNYTCQICKETVSTRAKFDKHIKNHLEKDLKCQICDQKFQNLAKYGYHKVDQHSIMRPYDCVLCTDNFCTRQELFIHLHNHIGKTLIDSLHIMFKSQLLSFFIYFQR